LKIEEELGEEERKEMIDSSFTLQNTREFDGLEK